MFSSHKKLKQEKTSEEVSAEKKISDCKHALKKILNKQVVDILTLEQTDFILIKFKRSANFMKFHDKKHTIQTVLKNEYGDFFIKNFKTGFDKSNRPCATFFIPVDELYSVISTGKKMDADSQENSEQASEKEHLEYKM